jgi:hypothetical protein
VTVRERLAFPQTLDVAKRILVVPFENLTPFPEAGLIVADAMADELRAWQGFEILDRHAAEGRARSGEVALPLHWNRAEAVRFGRAARADIVVFGTVHEFGYLREAKGLTERATFAAVARMASTQSARVVWDGSLVASGGGELATGRPPLIDVSRSAIEEALRRVFESYEDYRVARDQEKKANETKQAPASAAPKAAGKGS